MIDFLKIYYKVLKDNNIMKLYKGDVIRFQDSPDFFIGKVTGKTLKNGDWIRHEVKVLRADKNNVFSFGPTIGENYFIDIYNYKAKLFGSYNDTDENVTLIRPGWIRRQRRPFFKRLKYLFLNRF